MLIGGVEGDITNIAVMPSQCFYCFADNSSSCGWLRDFLLSLEACLLPHQPQQSRLKAESVQAGKGHPKGTWDSVSCRGLLSWLGHAY